MRKSIFISAVVALFLFLGITFNFDIGPGLIFVLLLRLLIPFTIFRWPLWGTIASLLADGLDVVFADILGSFGINSKVPEGFYDLGDKILDTFYLAIAFVVSLNWENRLAKWASGILFVYRVIGVLLFEVTNLRVILFIFPNLFENWFLFWAARNRYFSNFKLTKKRLAIVLFILLIPKMVQEYALHYAIVHPWTRIKEFLGFF